MNIIILSNSEFLYSTQRLIQEFTLAGHTVESINPTSCFMDVETNLPMVHYKNRKLNQANVIIPRIGTKCSSYGMTIVRQFEMMGLYCLNSSNSIGRSRDKLRSLQLLSKHGLPLPKTSFASNTEQVETLIDMVGGAPCVFKLLEGSQGRGVCLAETRQAAESIIDTFKELNANFLVQEFIHDTSGTDIRCFVVGDKVVASMMRIAKEGDFRSNIHRGGTGVPVEITKYEREIAIEAAQVMKLKIAGVDIMRSKAGPKILEVNSSPGLEGIEEATKINIAKEIVQFVEEDSTEVDEDI